MLGSGNRKFQRAEAEVPVVCEGGGLHLVEHATNLGAGGMFVHSEHPPQTGTVLDLSFTIPSIPGEFRVKGRVVWTRDPEEGGEAGMGIEFLDLTQEDRLHLAVFVRQASYLH